MPQGCPLSPRLFNIYAREIMREADIKRIRFKINGNVINSINYADDNMLTCRPSANNAQ